MRNYNVSNMGCLSALLIILITCAIIAGCLMFSAWLVMLLWNAVVPMIWVSAPTISYWTAMGVMLLCHILFGSIVISKNK